MHVNVTYLDDHDVIVCAGSLKSSNPAVVTLPPTTAPEPAPPVTAQGDLHVNTINGETLDFWLCMSATGPLVVGHYRFGEPDFYLSLL